MTTKASISINSILRLLLTYVVSMSEFNASCNHERKVFDIFGFKSHYNSLLNDNLLKLPLDINK